MGVHCRSFSGLKRDYFHQLQCFAGRECSKEYSTTTTLLQKSCKAHEPALGNPTWLKTRIVGLDA
jgi:hypothetical protein